jgi:hypothetical protein
MVLRRIKMKRNDIALEAMKALVATIPGTAMVSENFNHIAKSIAGLSFAIADQMLEHSTKSEPEKKCFHTPASVDQLYTRCIHCGDVMQRDLSTGLYKTKFKELKPFQGQQLTCEHIGTPVRFVKDLIPIDTDIMTVKVGEMGIIASDSDPLTGAFLVRIGSGMSQYNICVDWSYVEVKK